MIKQSLLTIVIPAYNEEEVIIEFYNRLIKIMENIGYDYEIIFVDDGSIDKTMEILRNISEKNKKIKILSFSRNFGHMVALSAGLDYAKGDAVITMDADLQHPPELIPELLKKWNEGVQVVNTIRKDAGDSSIFKVSTAKFFYWLINRIGKIKLRPNVADFRLLDRQVVETLKNMKERSRFLRGLIGWIGYKQDFVTYQANPRLSGKTKYSFFRMFSFAIDGITSFSSFPLRAATYLGLIVAFFSFIYIIGAIYAKFTNQAVSGWASLLVTVLFIGGIQLIFLGIIGEYLSRIYEETKQRPLYIIKKKFGFNENG